jgi:hypothetical protein
MDGWRDHYIAQCQFWFYKVVFGKMEKGAGGYCRATGMVRSTCRVLPRKWRWSCLIDLVYEIKRVTPFLEILLKLFYKRF